MPTSEDDDEGNTGELLFLNIHTYTYICVYIYTHTFICMYMYMCMYIYMMGELEIPTSDDDIKGITGELLCLNILTYTYVCV